MFWLCSRHCTRSLIWQISVSFFRYTMELCIISINVDIWCIFWGLYCAFLLCIKCFATCWAHFSPLYKYGLFTWWLKTQLWHRIYCTYQLYLYIFCVVTGLTNLCIYFFFFFLVYHFVTTWPVRWPLETGICKVCLCICFISEEGHAPKTSHGDIQINVHGSITYCVDDFFSFSHILLST